MKKIYLCTLIVLSFLSCEPKYSSEKAITVSKIKEETLDERIKSSDSILSNDYEQYTTELCMKTEEILKNQIVIMKTLKELNK